MPMVGAATACGDLLGQGFGHALDHDGEGAGLVRRPWRRRMTRAASSSVRPLAPEAAERVDGLRAQADMAHHRDAALGEKRDRLGHVGSALQLDRLAPVSFMTRAAFA